MFRFMNRGAFSPPTKQNCLCPSVCTHNEADSGEVWSNFLSHSGARWLFTEFPLQMELLARRLMTRPSSGPSCCPRSPLPECPVLLNQRSHLFLLR